MTFPRTALPATVTAVALLASACGSGGTDTPAADSTGTDSPATETTAPAAADFDAALCDPLTTFVDGSVNIADPERVDAVRTLADAFPDAPFADYAEVWEPLADAGELTIELFVDYTADVEPLLTQPILPDAADAAASACDLDEHATSLLVNGPTQTPRGRPPARRRGRRTARGGPDRRHHRRQRHHLQHIRRNRPRTGRGHGNRLHRLPVRVRHPVLRST